MKPAILCTIAAASLCLAGRTQTADLAATQLTSKSDYAVTERGPHHRVWTRMTEAGPESYTELATGMHVLNERGEWIAASEELEQFPGGAVGRHGQHFVIIANNLATPGAVDLQGPDGKRFRSHLLGLSYEDASGMSVLIAEVKDCQGKLAQSDPSRPPNLVIFEDAMTDIPVTVRYRNSLAGFEQDVIITGPDLPAPHEYGLSDDTARLQVLTELVDCTISSVSQSTLSGPDGEPMPSQTIGLGAMLLGNGNAIRLGSDSPASAIPMAKRIEKLSGRDFLVEEVSARTVLRELAAVKWEGAATKSTLNRTRHLASMERKLPVLRKEAAERKPMELAKVIQKEAVLLLDYTTLNGGYTNYVFSSQVTYYISGAVTFSGTTTFMPGNIIKVAEQPAAKITLNGPAILSGLPYQPIIMTSANDNVNGQNISGSTGNPNNTNSPIYLEWTVDQTNALNYLRIRFANTGLKGTAFTKGIWHSQFLKCGTAVQVTSSTALDLRNVLIAQGTNCVSLPGALRGEHLTLDQCASFCPISYTGASLTNSVLTAITSTTGVTSYGGASHSSGVGVYQSFGAGNYYLASESTNRAAGLTNLNSTLLADLKNRTTYPPIWLTNAITVDTTLTPAVGRNSGLPDRGYSYDIIDYCASNILITNCTLLLANGVCLAGVNSGCVKFGSGKLTSQGSPSNLNRITRYETVQEQPLVVGAAADTLFHVNSGIFALKLRFTDVVVMACASSTARGLLPTSSYVTPWEMSHCQLRGVDLLLYAATSGTSIGLTNNLFYQCTLDFYQDTGIPSMAIQFRNNLFSKGTLSLRAYTYDTWTLKDNLFDCNTLTMSGLITTLGYNGYRSGLTSLGGSNNKTGLTMDYQGGAATNFFGVLGNFYYPASGGSLTQLIDAGSRTAAAASLYHFTTVPAQTKEASSQVDIGYHLVALDANGRPVDSDSDGTADYLEDLNGNGTVDSGETDWQSASDPGLSVRILRPGAASNLP